MTSKCEVFSYRFIGAWNDVFFKGNAFLEHSIQRIDRMNGVNEWGGGQLCWLTTRSVVIHPPYALSGWLCGIATRTMLYRGISIRGKGSRHVKMEITPKATSGFGGRQTQWWRETRYGHFLDPCMTKPLGSPCGVFCHQEVYDATCRLKTGTHSHKRAGRFATVTKCRWPIDDPTRCMTN